MNMEGLPTGPNAAADEVVSAATGAAKAGMEAKDFVFGEPNPEDKWAVRSRIEQTNADLKRDSVVNGIASGLAQFGVGFIGLGKIKYVAQGLEAAANAGRLVHWGAEAARGATAGAVFMDPHEQRLSNLVEQYPALSNPITNYLASKPEDSSAQGRMKNAIEGVVLDATLSGAVALVAKGVKAFRAGDVVSANTAGDAADAAFERAANAASAEETLQGNGFPQHATTSDLSPESAGVNMPGGIGGAADVSRETGSVGGTTRGPIRDLAPGNDGSISSSSISDSDGGGRSSRYDRGGGGEHAASDEGRLTQPGRGDGPDKPGGGTGNDALGAGAGEGRTAEAAGTLSAPEITPAQVSESLARLKQDNDALTTYGSRSAAIDAGYEFTPHGDSTGLIPWQKLRTTEDTREWMARTIDQQSTFINAARGGNAEGILTDEAVAKMVQDRAKTWDEDPDALMGALHIAGNKAPEMAANMETSFLIANKAYQDAFELAVRIKSDNFTGFGSRGEALAALQQRMQMATTMYANGKAIVSNAARTMRRMRGQFSITDAQLANINHTDPEAMLKLVYATAGDRAALVQTGKLTAVTRITNELASFQAANLLWGWKTQVVNFATSAAMLVWRPLEVAVGSRVMRMAGMRGGEAIAALRSQSLREVTYLGSVLSDGWQAASKAFIEGDSILLPHNQEAFNVSGGGGQSLTNIIPEFKAINSMEDVTHNALEAAMLLKNAGGTTLKMPLRALGAADEMVKTMRYRAIIMSKASLEADRMGLEAGSQEYKDFVSQRLTASVDDLGRGVDRDALQEAQASTFQNDLISTGEGHLGGWARGYSTFSSQQAPFLRLITPFIKTPTNLMRYGVKLTPGVNFLQKEYYAALSGSQGLEAQARATGQFTLGIMLTGIAAMMWSAGRLVGEGPQNPEQAKMWRAEGNRANSIVWHDENGAKQSFELNRFDPIGMPMVLMADILSLSTSGYLREEDQRSVEMSIVLAMAHFVKDKTYLKGIADFTDALTDDNKLSGWFKRVAPGFLPMSSLMPTINPDPVMHEVRGVVDALMAKVPGLSATLPPSRDILGDPILAPTGFVSSQKNPGPLMETLDAMFANTGQFIQPPAAKGMATGGVDLRDFKLKDSGRTAYDRYQELAGHPTDGPSLRDALTELVQSKDFQNLPHGGAMEEGTKAGAMMKLVKGYREGAWKTMLGENEDLRDAVLKRRIAIGQAVSLGVKDPKVAGGQSAVSSIGKLLQSYGIVGQ